jgi:hypothetical protein
LESWEEYSPFIPFIQFDDLSILKLVRKPAGMKLSLVDMNDDLIEAWHEAFSLYPEVRIFDANILSVPVNTVVSPANRMKDYDLPPRRSR